MPIVYGVDYQGMLSCLLPTLSRLSVSKTAQQAAFATGVLPDLYAFHRYTRNSACLYSARAPQFARPTRG